MNQNCELLENADDVAVYPVKKSITGVSEMEKSIQTLKFF
jgi:hypothetical protein